MRAALRHRGSAQRAGGGGHADARRPVRLVAGAVRGLQPRGAPLQVVAAECATPRLRRIRQRGGATADPGQDRADGRGDGHAHRVLEQRHPLAGIPPRPAPPQRSRDQVPGGDGADRPAERQRSVW